METIIKMLDAISKLYEQQRKVEEKKREEGDFFNVFNTIHLRTEEVRLHSAFIAELLNPKGSHGLGRRFLQAFLELIGIQDGFIDYHRCPHGIITERGIGNKTANEGGQIDIIIEDGKHAIIIENKIYAGDQGNQMLRYNNYGKKKFPDGYKLVYLTLDGHEPCDDSLGDDIYEYVIASYEEDIVNWLEKCYTISEGKPLVQSVIKQYCELVKQLTNTDMDTQYRNDLMKTMLEPTNVIAVGEMMKIQNEWLGEILDAYIWNPLKSYADSKGLRFGKDCSSGANSAWVFREKWNYYKILVWTNRSDHRNMHIGISWYGEKPGRNNMIYKKDFHKLDCLLGEPCSDWPYGYEYLPDDIMNWDYYITEEIVQGKVSQFILQKIEEILAEIEELGLRMP